MTSVAERAAVTPQDVCVVGAGYVGLTAAACLAELGHRVRCLEVNRDRLALLQARRTPIVEPGLDQIVTRGIRSGRLRFTDDAASRCAALRSRRRPGRSELGERGGENTLTEPSSVGHRRLAPSRHWSESLPTGGDQSTRTRDNPSVTVKLPWATRRIPEDLLSEWACIGEAAIGDVLLCEVLKPSLHSRLEDRTGARSKLYPGDLVLCVVGRRYATAMLEATAEVKDREIDLISASGLCGRVVRTSRDSARPTRLRPLAQAVHDGRPLNVGAYGMPTAPLGTTEPAWTAVFGSDMDSGKTTACSALINGLVRSGWAVGAAKLSGTASARDHSSFRDAGARPVFDFLDMGWPSTAGCSGEELREVTTGLLGHLRAADVEVGVLEIADGLLQPETAAIVEALHRDMEDIHVVLTVREALAAVAGVALLQRMGYRVDAVSGLVTNSPLAIREVEEATGVACIPTSELSSKSRHAAFVTRPTLRLAETGA